MTAKRISNRQRAVDHVTKFPGSTLREIAVALDLAARDDYTSLSAQMAQLCKLKKLRKDSMLNGGTAGALKYWPLPPAPPAPPKQPKPKAPPKPVRARDPSAPAQTAAQKRAGYASNRAHTPKPHQQFSIVSAAALHVVVLAKGERESVDSFRKRGGQIEVLAPHIASNPLRFDHSDNKTPVGLRRPSLRRRPAAGAL